LEQLRIQQGEQLVTKTVQKDPPPPLDTVKKAGVQLARPVRRASLALATSGVSEMLGATAGAVAGTLAAEADDQMQKFWDFEKSRRTAMTEFRATLEQFTRPENNGQDKTHVIFVIDELDRCRPDYAIELLEVIKHFFSVPHLHFVLGVNLSALEDMVRTRYGAKIDAQTYLGKFIQVTLELPDEITINRRQKQTILHYLDHLVYTMAIKDYIGNPLRDQVEVVARNNSVSLRDIGTIVSAIALASSEVTINPEYKDFFHGWIDVMNDLIIAKIIRPDLYPKMLDATITPDEILSYFGATENTVKGIYQYVVKSQL
ncbi:MAG: P-loop NTPase fold protein, partial [Aestuariivita sp.]|nr:P-loop NTPase fold protein [Aestuariivita sp.]